MKVQLPEEIKVKMNNYRNGFCSLPKEYVEFHKDLAENAIEGLKEQGLIIHNTYMSSDGWGMKVLHLIVENKGELMKLKWHDGNQEFFFQSSSGGSWPYRLKQKGA